MGGEDTPSFLISRCKMRPRYLLRLINFCKGSAINFGRDRIDQDDILSGLSLYSTEIVKEIGLEIWDVLPASEDILYVFLGEPKEMQRSAIEALLLPKLLDPSILQGTMTLLLWYGC